MIGGYISCVSNNWQPLNPGERYNDLEARGLNKLGICFDSNGTDRYNIDGLKKWYFKNNKTNLYKLGEIVEELKKNALKYKIAENKLREGYNLLFDSYNMREKKSYVFESREGITARTQGHIDYYNDLNDFISILDNVIKYIDEHKEIVARFKRRKSRSPSRRRRRRNSRSSNSSRSRSRGKYKKTKKKNK
jgi:hypothetical protein